MGLGQVVGVDVIEVRITLGVGSAELRFIAQLLVLHQRGDGVEAKARHATLQPEAHRFEHGALDVRVTPVEIGLLAIVPVAVELIDRRHVLPG